MLNIKIDEFKFLIPKIKEKIQNLKNRKNRKIERINIVSDPTFALISMGDVVETPNIEKENIFEIQFFFENLVLKQAKTELEDNKCDYKMLYHSFKNSIIEQLNLLEGAFIKLNAKASGFAVQFFNDFGCGVLNDDTKFLENLEQLVTFFALKTSTASENSILGNIQTYLNREKDYIIEKINNMNSSLLKESAFINSNLFPNSIVLKPEEHEMVHCWIKEQVGNVKTFKCLFNTKDHGFTEEEFHRKCDEKGPIIVFVETKTGKRFGGYANCSWPQSKGYRTDENCFIFSLDLKEKFLHKPGNLNSIHWLSNWGPRFGAGCDFALYEYCNSNTKSYCTANSTYDWKGKTEADFAGSRNFTVKNYEVYSIK